MLSYGQQQKVKNYFPMPNEIFHLDLSDGAILVYAFLMYCEDRKTYTCHPSYATIGKYIHRTDNSIAKYVRELEAKIHTIGLLALLGLFILVTVVDVRGLFN